MCIRDSPPASLIATIGFSNQNGAERTPRELRGPILRSFLGPRGSRFERLKRSCMFHGSWVGTPRRSLESLVNVSSLVPQSCPRGA
eukprot:7461418-Alexandrium_andersonii.AAC.1